MRRTSRTREAGILLFTTLILAITALAQPPQPPRGAETVLPPTTPTHEGEICVACGKPISAHDPTLLIRGQRVPVHAHNCLDVFMKAPEHYTAQLEARSALFSATAPSEASHTLSRGWFFLGLYAVAGLIFSAVCAQRALAMGLPIVPWFFAGLFLNAVGYLLLLMRRPREPIRYPAGVPRGMGKVSATYAPEPCPHCGGTNHPAAEKCAGCGSLLQPRVASEVSRTIH